jgi:hypothetical protein
VAVKNASDVSRAFFGRLRHQAYPDYRIIAAVESEEDTAQNQTHWSLTDYASRS